MARVSDMARVLIVDDDADARELIRETLQAAGYATVEADHGAAALGQIRRRAPDLLITDLEMPIMDGWELMDALDRSAPGVPTVVVTGRDDPVVTRTRTPIISKPIDADELLREVRRVCPPDVHGRA